jgi:DNA-directed RNA polymerase subunit E'/Rpb7
MDFYDHTIPLTISLLPDEQNSCYKDVILSKLRKEYEKKAFEKIGIIDSIMSIESIKHEEMMEIIPIVQFIVDTRVRLYFPKVKDTLLLPINKILSCGIFLEVPCLRALVPTVPSNYTLEKKNNNFQYINKNTGVILKEKDILKVIVKTIRFEKNSFHCIVDFFTDSKN